MDLRNIGYGGRRRITGSGTCLVFRVSVSGVEHMASASITIFLIKLLHVMCYLTTL
jgi:hypothetical protein